MTNCEICYKKLHWKQFRQIERQENYDGRVYCVEHWIKYYGDLEN